MMRTVSLDKPCPECETTKGLVKENGEIICATPGCENQGVKG